MIGDRDGRAAIEPYILGLQLFLCIDMVFGQRLRVCVRDEG